MVQLREYLKTTGETVEEFSERARESFQTIRKIVYRQRQPSLELAVKITRLTKRRVQPEDMLIAAVKAADPSVSEQKSARAVAGGR